MLPQASVTSSPTSTSSLQGGVPEVFSTGAFLRVKLEEAPLAATPPPHHPSDEASGDPSAAGGKEGDEEATGTVAPLAATNDGGGDGAPAASSPEGPAPHPSLPSPAPSSQLLIRLVPTREEIVDVAAGLFDDMTEAAGQVGCDLRRPWDVAATYFSRHSPHSSQVNDPFTPPPPREEGTPFNTSDEQWLCPDPTLWTKGDKTVERCLKTVHQV